MPAPRQSASGSISEPSYTPTSQLNLSASPAPGSGMSDSVSVSPIGVPNSTESDGENATAAAGFKSTISNADCSLNITSTVGFWTLKSSDVFKSN